MTATPVYARLVRVTYSGTLASGEIFAHGLWMTVNTGATDADVTAAAELWLTTFLATPASSVGASSVQHLFDPTVVWTRVSTREYNPATGLPTFPPVDAAITIAGLGSSSLPFQCSLAITLWNGRTMGKRKYNRFFPPPFESSVLASSGRVFSGLPGDLALAVVAGQAAIQALTPPASLVYYGHRDLAMHSLAETHVGDVIDTQRRRRNALVEVVSPQPF
jgi:hypothetical protein